MSRPRRIGVFLIPERIDKRRKRRRGLAPVWVVQMKSLKMRAPISQNGLEPSVGQVGGYQGLRNIGKAQAVSSALKNVNGAVEDERAVDLDGKCLVVFRKLPGID